MNKKEAGTITLNDGLGQEVIREKVNAEKGINHFLLDLNGLSSGSYSLMCKFRTIILPVKKIIISGEK